MLFLTLGVWLKSLVITLPILFSLSIDLTLTTLTNPSIKNRCRYFFVVFLFFCSEICQVNNYKRQALYLLIVKSGTL